MAKKITTVFNCNSVIVCWNNWKFCVDKALKAKNLPKLWLKICCTATFLAYRLVHFCPRHYDKGPLYINSSICSVYIVSDIYKIPKIL